MSQPRLFGDGIAARRNRSGPVRRFSWLNDKIVFGFLDWICDEADFQGGFNHHLFVLTESGSTRETQVRDGSRLIYEGRDFPGALSIIPAGTDRTARYRDVNMAISALWIRRDYVSSLTERRSFEPGRMLINAVDDRIHGLMAWLKSEASLSGLSEPLFAESIASLILYRSTGTGRIWPRQDHVQRLDKQGLSTIRDYVMTHLGEPLSLTVLAAVLNMPVDTFSRQFRATAGVSPYAFVLQRRVDRAVELLADPRRSIAEIALECGFSGQSHLTSVFGRIRGTSPSAFRKLCPRT